jgi:DNA modification methylase
MESKLLNGNNIELLRELEENSVDSIVTDPPYGLSFMNKKWDYDVPSIEFWTEAFRVLKPGGHVLSFGGTRTYHRMVVNMEDAGFEIRDQIQWIYGSGFPKSHNIGKAYDKKMGNDRDVVGTEKQNNFDKYDASMMTKENRDSETTLYKELEITKGQSPYEMSVELEQKLYQSIMHQKGLSLAENQIEEVIQALIEIVKVGSQPMLY